MIWRAVTFVLVCLLVAVPAFSEEQGSKETALRPGSIDLHTVDPRRAAEVSFPERTATSYPVQSERPGLGKENSELTPTRPLGLLFPKTLWADPKDRPDPEVLKRQALEQLRRQNLNQEDGDLR